MMGRAGTEAGVRVVDFVARLPFLGVAAILIWQFAIFFYATMVAASAAEAESAELIQSR